MNKRFSKVIFLSIISMLCPGISKASIGKVTNSENISDIREKTIELIVQSGSYNLANSILYVERLDDDQVKELFKVLSNGNLQLSGSITLIGN